MPGLPNPALSARGYMTIFSRAFRILAHYLTFWHLKRALIFVLVDVVLLSFVRRGVSDHVLVVKFDQLGDYILARKFLLLLREHPSYRSRKIVLCANPALRDFIEAYDAKAFDEILWIDRLKLINDPWYRFITLRLVRKTGCRTAIKCMYGLESISADSVIRAAGMRLRPGGAFMKTAPIRPMPTPNVNLAQTFYDPGLDPDRVMFDFTRHRSLFSVALPGVELPTDTRFTPLPVALPPVKSPFAVLMPGASDAFREWPPERFARVARHLSEQRGLHIVVPGHRGRRGQSHRHAAGRAGHRDGRFLRKTDASPARLPDEPVRHRRHQRFRRHPPARRVGPARRGRLELLFLRPFSPVSPGDVRERQLCLSARVYALSLSLPNAKPGTERANTFHHGVACESVVERVDMLLQRLPIEDPFAD